MQASRRVVLTAAVASLGGCLSTFEPAEQPGTHPPDAELRLDIERPGENGERVYVHNDGSTDVPMRGYTLEYDDGVVFEFARITLEPGSWVAVESTSFIEGEDRSDPPKFVRGAGRDDQLCPDGRVTLVGPQGTIVGSTTCPE